MGRLQAFKLPVCVLQLVLFGTAALAQEPALLTYEPAEPFRFVAQDESPAEDDTSQEMSLEERLLRLETAMNRVVGSPAEGADASAESDSSSEELPIKSRLEKIEDLLKKSAEDAEKEKAPSYPTLEIGGRIHFDSWFFPETTPGVDFFENPGTGVDPEDRFFFRRIRLELGGDIWENMIWRFQIDFNSPEEPEMKDVFIGFTDLPVLQDLIIGNHKRPLGLDHLNSSRFNVFIERPLVVEAFNEDARRLGISSRGVSEEHSSSWAYGVFLLENVFDDGEVIGDSLQPSLNGRYVNYPWYDESSGGRGYFHWAVSGMLADPDGDVDPRDTNENLGRFRTRSELRSNRRWLDTGPVAGATAYEVLGIESILNIGALQVVGEYQWSWMQRDDHTPGTGPDLFFHGAYIYVAYMLTGEHVPYDRASGTIGRVKPFENFFLVDRCCGGHGTGWGAWQVALRYSYLDLSDHDIGGGVENNVTAGLVWHFNSNANLQMNLIYGEIDEHAPVGGFDEGHFVGLGTRLRMDF